MNSTDMRPQEQAVLRAVQDGAFCVEVPFLTQAEVIAEVNELTGVLGAKWRVLGSELNAPTLQNWLKRDIFKPASETPGIRNRLYATVDVMALAVVSCISRFGLPLEVASCTAMQFLEVLKQTDDWASEAHNLLAVRMVQDGYGVTTPDFSQKPEPVQVQKFFKKHNTGMALFIDWKLIANLAIALCRERWKAKATRFLEKAKALRQT